MTERHRTVVKPVTPKQAKAARVLSAGWAAAILALLVILFFHDVVVGRIDAPRGRVDLYRGGGP